MRKIETVFAAGSADPVDIRINICGRQIPLLGPAGAARELAILPAPLCPTADQTTPFKAGKELPVLLGSGLGHALAALILHLEEQCGPDFPLAVVDKELDVLELTRLREKYAERENILWIDTADAEDAIKQLSKWQIQHKGLPFCPIVNPAYLRLDRANNPDKTDRADNGYYSQLREALKASASADFWNKAAYAKFSGPPRLLLITSKYFLIGEIEAACKRQGIEYHLLRLPDKEIALTYFMEQLLTALVNFKPDFALTINHLGVDREGVLQSFLSKVKLPLASWFVDNPNLILYSYDNLVSPWTAVFTWDADNQAPLRQMGFEHVFYLPLGTDHLRFAPPQDPDALLKKHPDWRAGVSFVGNSMLHKVRARLKQINLPPILLDCYHETAAGFADSDARSVSAYLETRHPEQFRAFQAMEPLERRLGYEAMLTWEATLQYRLDCVQGTLDQHPLIVGDDGWFELFADETRPWRYHSELTYYTDLPEFYPLSDINFNCTSKQMKGAVNQRIFDVPAAGAFVLTDWREQIENLFEPGKEVICFHAPEEVPDLLKHYLRHPAERQKITQAARKRILDQHCYEHRLETVISHMRKTFG
ncbi:MAG: glycosyltransferase [Deltaproteobacteria bacterium]|jgi:spore maturation protein CgeB|nr:glycosyltransferase [Deltaproteobacteria bacterium]